MTAEVIALKTKQSPWWLHLISGALNIVIGILLLSTPAKTVVLLVLALGIYWLIHGLVTLVSMFIDHSAWFWKLLIGVISIAAGIIVLRHPLIGALVIPAIIILFLGIQGLITGVLSLIMAFQGGGFGAAILGVLNIIFGVILVANYSNLVAIASLVLVAGIFAIIGGLLQIARAFTQRNV
jgi:uncharacterized membrane protein HdeD (DUF308 family)